MYIFEFDGNQWVERIGISDKDEESLYWFGWSIAINDDHAFIGATSRNDPERVYVFQFGSNWYSELQEIISPRMNDLFVRTVALSGERLLIGAPYDDEMGNSAGAAYMYSLKPYTPTERPENHWLESSEARLIGLIAAVITIISAIFGVNRYFGRE